MVPLDRHYCITFFMNAVIICYFGEEGVNFNKIRDNLTDAISISTFSCLSFYRKHKRNFNFQYESLLGQTGYVHQVCIQSIATVYLVFHLTYFWKFCMIRKSYKQTKVTLMKVLRKRVAFGIRGNFYHIYASNIVQLNIFRYDRFGMI